MELLPVRRLIMCIVILTIEIFSSTVYAAYKIDGFKEKIAEQVEVSGGILIGFQFSSSSSVPDLSNLYIARPKDIDSLYLKISSVDGVYSAEMEVSFDSWSSSWEQIVIPSEHQALLSKYAKDELVVYAFREQEDTRGNKGKKFHNVFPSSWGKPSTESAYRGYFFINSAAPIASYAVPKSGKNVFCKNVRSEIRTAFNRSCSLDSDLKAGNNLVVMKTGRNKKYLVWLPE